MSDTWANLLYEGSFDGVRFDFVNTKDADANTLDKQTFPGRDGQRIAPRARAGQSLDIVAIFIEDDYPEQLNKLLAVLANGGAVKELVHPVFGKLSAAADNWTVTHDSEDAIDSAMVSIKFEISNEGSSGPLATRNTTPARANEVRSLGDSVLVALSAFQAATEIQSSSAVLAVIGAVNAATSIADSLEADAANLSTLAIQATSNGGLATCDTAIALLADYSTIEQYDLAAAVLEMSHALRALAQDLINARPPLSIIPVAADTNLLQLAHDLDADPEELLTLNSFPDPSLIPAGFKVQAYAA